MSITVTGQPDIDQATAEIAVALRDAAAIRVEADQNYYDAAVRLRDAIMAGTRALGQPQLTYSAVTDDEWQTPYATAADYAAYIAARTDGPDMDDASVAADGGAIVVSVHQVPVYRAEFRDLTS
jgi:hypothetical protein